MQIIADTATDDLMREYRDLRATAAPSPEQTARREVLYAELARRVAQPPAGYTLPKPARDLLTHAEAHGWKTLAHWKTASDDTPFVVVSVGRELTPAEKTIHRAEGRCGSSWEYRVVWHGWGSRAGALRRFGRILGHSPARPSNDELPSVAQVRALITANPAP